MRLGILETDRLDPELQRLFGSYDAMFRKLLSAVDPHIEFINYQVIDHCCPDTLDECDAYLITGSKASVYDREDWITELAEFVRLTCMQRKLLVGICFGHQLVAEALGGKVEKNRHGWGVGVHSYRLLQQEDWIRPYQPRFSLIVSHQDQVVELPAGAKLLAGSDFCPNAAFTVGDHLLTFQGHPEFSPDYALNRLESRRRQVGEARYREAVNTLTGTADAPCVARWIMNFIKRH